MRLRFLQRRTIWCPTVAGWIVIVVLLASPVALWLTYGERYLSATDRVRAEVLIVEGWIGAEGVRASASEFRDGGYKYIVAAGATTSSRWSQKQWSYASLVEKELIQLGIPNDKIIVAPSQQSVNGRTRESALAVARVMKAHQLDSSTANVFTLGSHARRSWLCYRRALKQAAVGVVGWSPAEYQGKPWWTSSERSKELIIETVGILYEKAIGVWRSPAGD